MNRESPAQAVTVEAISTRRLEFSQKGESHAPIRVLLPLLQPAVLKDADSCGIQRRHRDLSGMWQQGSRAEMVLCVCGQEERVDTRSSRITRKHATGRSVGLRAPSEGEQRDRSGLSAVWCAEKPPKNAASCPDLLYSPHASAHPSIGAAGVSHFTDCPAVPLRVSERHNHAAHVADCSIRSRRRSQHCC